jgi:hypothetical protein
MLMLKIAKVVGIVLLLPLLFTACANPQGFFLDGPTYYRPTPTPRSLTAAEVASLVQTQLNEVQGLPVEVLADGETGLFVLYDLAATTGTEGGDQEAILAISRVVGGLLEINYTSINQVTLVMMLGDQEAGLALTATADDILDWYNANINRDEFLARWTEPTMGGEAAPAEGEAAPAEGEAAPAEGEVEGPLPEAPAPEVVPTPEVMPTEGATE